jgi:hypothetical protein
MAAFSHSLDPLLPVIPLRQPAAQELNADDRVGFSLILLLPSGRNRMAQPAKSSAFEVSPGRGTLRGLAAHPRLKITTAETNKARSADLAFMRHQEMATRPAIPRIAASKGLHCVIA